MTAQLLVGALAFFCGLGAGALLLRGRLAASNDAAAQARAQLADLRRRVSVMRHDMRGVLSPALLVSDRLLTHEEAHVRRAGEVMIRTVDRATQLLATTKLDEASAQPPISHGAEAARPAAAQL